MTLFQAAWVLGAAVLLGSSCGTACPECIAPPSIVVRVLDSTGAARTDATVTVDGERMSVTDDGRCFSDRECTHYASAEAGTHRVEVQLPAHERATFEVEVVGRFDGCGTQSTHVDVSMKASASAVVSRQLHDATCGD